MLKRGSEYIKGHRAELVIIQFFIVACWLIPIAIELLLRRFLPATVRWQSILLVGSFLLNRMLLAPAHTGYYACCRRLAAVTAPTAMTSEIEDLREELTAPTLLSCFFLDYRHPVKSMKWQLRYDALRFVVFAVFLFPCVFFWAVGAREGTVLLQAVCAGGGLLCGISGAFCACLLLLRLRPMLYRRPQYGSFWAQVAQALRISHGQSTRMLLLRVKVFPFTLLFTLPFSCFRVRLCVEEAVLFAKRPKKVKKRRERIFHTRVLRDA